MVTRGHVKELDRAHDGKATALLLAERGAKVVRGARCDDRLEALASRITIAGCDDVLAGTDVKQRGELTALVALGCERFGKLDVFVDNARMGRSRASTTMTGETMPLPFLDAAKDLMVMALGAQLSPGVADYLDLFCQDGVLETPYVSPGSPGRWEGPAISIFLEKLRGVIRLADFSLVAAYPAQDGVTTVLEYDGTVHLEKPGTRFRQRYVAVVTLRDGRIALWREYLNPLASQAAA